MYRKMIAYTLSLALVICGITFAPNHTTKVSAVAGPSSSGWQLQWSDEFNGTSLNNNWKYEFGRGEDGWGNNELQFYTSDKSNVDVSDGNLKITARRQNYSGAQYTSGRLSSEDRKSFKYGKIEARIKVEGEYLNCVWPAFWMMGCDKKTNGWPACGELDIMEHANDKNYTEGTIHYGKEYASHILWGSSKDGAYNYYADGDGISNWHTYGVTWDENHIKWYMDDKVFQTADIRNEPRHSYFTKDAFIILNLAIGGPNTGFTGYTVPDENFQSATMYVDYVREYSYNGEPETEYPQGYTEANYGNSWLNTGYKWSYMFVNKGTLLRAAYKGGNTLDSISAYIIDASKPDDNREWSAQLKPNINLLANTKYNYYMKIDTDATGDHLRLRHDISGNGYVDLIDENLTPGTKIYQGTFTTGNTRNDTLRFALGEISSAKHISISEFNVSQVVEISSTVAPTTTTVKPTTTVAPTTTVKPTTTAAPTTTRAPVQVPAPSGFTAAVTGSKIRFNWVGSDHAYLYIDGVKYSYISRNTDYFGSEFYGTHSYQIALITQDSFHESLKTSPIIKTIELPTTVVSTTTVKPTTTAAPTTTIKPTTTVAPTTTIKPTTTVVPTTTVKPTTTAAPTTTVAPTTAAPVQKPAPSGFTATVNDSKIRFYWVESDYAYLYIDGVKYNYITKNFDYFGPEFHGTHSYQIALITQDSFHESLKTDPLVRTIEQPTTVAPTTTAKQTTTVAPTTTVKSTTTVAPTTTVKPTTTAAPTTTKTPEPQDDGWINVEGGGTQWYYNNSSKIKINNVVGVNKLSDSDQQGIFITVPYYINEVSVNGVSQSTQTTEQNVCAIRYYTVVVFLSALTSYTNEIAIKNGKYISYIQIRNALATESKTGNQYDVEVYKTNDTYPTKSGLIFAGWFADANYTSAYEGTTGKAYAKFIDAKVLTVKFQWGVDYSALRFITTSDSLDYQLMGFVFSGTYGNAIITPKDKETLIAYKSIAAAGQSVYPKVFSNDSQYFFTYTIRGMDGTIASTWNVTPYYVTLDGTTVYGTPNKVSHTP